MKRDTKFYPVAAVSRSGPRNQKQPQKNNTPVAIHNPIGLKVFRFLPIRQNRYHL
jgi:hypothetical protein